MMLEFYPCSGKNKAAGQHDRSTMPQPGTNSQKYPSQPEQSDSSHEPQELSQDLEASVPHQCQSGSPVAPVHSNQDWNQGTCNFKVVHPPGLCEVTTTHLDKYEK